MEDTIEIGPVGLERIAELIAKKLPALRFTANVLNEMAAKWAQERKELKELKRK